MEKRTQTVLGEVKDKRLKAILYLLQERLEEFKREVDRSYELLSIGELTDLSKQIKESITSGPLSGIIDVSNDIDMKMKQLLDSFVVSFFKYRQDVIDTVLRCENSSHELYYAITLKEDDIDNRNKIFEFYDKYDLLDISNRYPIYFQFVPKELRKKIKVGEMINFA
jgi:hypothetical protein